MNIFFDLMYHLLYSYGVVIIALLMITLMKTIDFKIFTGLYFLLTAATIFTQWATFDMNIYMQLIVSSVAYILGLIIVGLFGPKVDVTVYSTAIAIIGLFPWYLGVLQSLFFVSLGVMFFIIVSIQKNNAAFKSINMKRIRLTDLKNRVDSETWDKFTSKAKVIPSTPFILSAFCAAVIYVI